MPDNTAPPKATNLPWYWWILENKWPWEQPTGTSPTEEGWIPFTNLPGRSTKMKLWDAFSGSGVTAPEDEIREWWELTDEEKQAKLLDTSKEPYTPPPDHQWEIRYYDDNGQPTPPYWALVSMETGETDDYGEAWQRYLDLKEIELAERELASTEKYREWQMRQGGEGGELKTAYQQQMERLAEEKATREEERASFEDYRKQLLSALTEPEDWIERWLVANYQPPEQEALPSGGMLSQWATAEQIRELQSELKGINPDTNPEAYKQVLDQITAKQERLTTLQAESPDMRLAQRMQELGISRIQEGNLPEEFWIGQPAKTTGVGTPPVPSWLPQYVPGQTAGAPITKREITTPSLQQWNQTPWSVRQGLSGYAEWAGGKPLEDILEQAALMAPRTPTTSRSWRPARQRR